jgi:hypothetical protein
MNNFCTWGLLSAALLVLSGCGGAGDAPAEVSAQDVPQKVGAAFADAPAETRKAAEEMAADVSTKPDEAIRGFEQMSQRPELTPAQRDAMAQAMAAAISELQKAAAAGNAQAQQALEARAARK